MRRTLVILCSGGPYHVPTLARVALFPIHLDPPTRQHRELFRLLLGAPDLATSTRSPHTPQQQPLSAHANASLDAAGHPGQSPLSTSANSSTGFASGVRGKVHNFLQRHRGESNDEATSAAVGSRDASARGNAQNSSSHSTLSTSTFPDEDPISCGCSSPFWYMEAFATSLREDSQLAPFDDIILIPNTRGPVSLRQSTHLAALAVLATRGLAHVHVDFTALEHPDESMPIIYELVCKYTNSVLVHWLQDAYEMQNWSHFAEFKNTVPMLLLQTQSYPPRALERQRPLGSVSRLTSRQYHSPIGPYVRSPEEAEYYRNAERFIQTSATMRRRNPSPMALTSASPGNDNYISNGYGETGLYERYESASLVNRESDYFDDVPDIPPNQRRRALPLDESGAEVSSAAVHAAWQGEENEMTRGTPPPMMRGVQDGLQNRERSHSTSTTALHQSQTRNGSSSGGVSSSRGVQRPASAGHDRLGLSYADCAKGRWWYTPGGRGDDEVELSRAYWSSTSSSWLGGGGGGVSSALPEWMEEVGSSAARMRHYRRFTEDHATPTNISDPALAEEVDGSSGRGGGGGNDGLISAATSVEGGVDGAGPSLDTVVSDDGFALAVDEQQMAVNGPTASEEAAADAAATARETEGKTKNGLSDTQTASDSSGSSGGDVASQSAVASSGKKATKSAEPSEASRVAAARENADEDTRKRFLTREIEDVRKMLDGMLRPAAATATAAKEKDGSAALPSADTRSHPASRDATKDALATLERKNASGRTAASASPSTRSGTSANNNNNNTTSSDGGTSSSRSLGRAFGAYEAHHHDAHHHARRRHRSVRQLIDELFPPRVAYGPGGMGSPAAIGAAENGLREYYRNGEDSYQRGSTGAAPSGRAVSAGSIFHTAVKTSPTHLSLMQQQSGFSGGSSGGASSGSSANHNSNSSNNSSGTGSGGGGGGGINPYSWLDSPMVEVHPITRSTGADVRQALWEQEIHPSSILMDCVQRYMEGHGLYRDPRKATAASLYAGVAGAEFSGGARGGGGGGGGPNSSGGGIGGPGGQLGAAAEMSGGFRDPATAGSGSAGSGGLGGAANSVVGNTIMDGRTGVRRVAPRDTSTLSFPGLIPRLELHYDRNNLLAREQFEKLRVFQCQDGEEPDLIVPIGGDGYMMHCIRKNWRRFIPFYGVNAGHVGYLLNDRSTLEELFSSPLKLHFTTMLYCQAEKEGDTGERMLLSELAFNDAWVERSSGQTALIRILVNGQERIRRLRGDGVLVSTAAGSTAYSQALGASPVPVGAPLIQVVGSNVVSPAQWRPAHLDQEDQVEFEVIDSTKRPCRCYVDSVDVGNVTRLLVRSSRVAGVTLAFSKSCDLQHKLYQMQFPKTL